MIAKLGKIEFPDELIRDTYVVKLKYFLSC